MPKEKLFNFQIKGIEIIDTSLVSPKNKINPKTEFTFKLQSQHSFNLERKLIIVTCYIDVLDNNSKEKLGHVSASCLYYVENLKQYFSKKLNTLDLSEDVGTHLNSISISTIRGVMYGIFRGTFLDGAILPIVNPKISKK